MKKITLFLLLILSTTFIGAKPEMSLEIIETFRLKDFPEPSGLAYSELSDTLFIVGDEGQVAELSLDGSILNETWLGERDLEGVAIHKEALYVLDERRNQILLLNSRTLEILKIVNLPEFAKGPYEGLSMDRDGALILVNQLSKKNRDAASILRIGTDGEVTTMPTHIKDQSSVTYHNTGLYILSDKDNRMYFFTLEGEPRWSCPLPGEHQEGIAIDGDGFFYIAQDSGGIVKMKLTGKEHD